MLVEHILRSELQWRTFHRHCVYAIRVFFDRKSELVVIFRIICETFSQVFGDGRALESVVIEELLTKWRRYPRFASHKGANLGPGNALKRGYDLDRG